MKCSYCGKKIDDKASVCPYCGMVFSVDAPEDEEVPSVSNVFQATLQEEEPVAPAQEIPADPQEESVEVVESVSDVEETFEAVREEIPVTEPETVEEAEDSAASDTAEEAEVAAEEAYAEGQEEEIPDSYEDISSVSSPEETAEGEAGASELDIRVPSGEITYPEYDAYRKRQEEEKAAADAEAAKQEDEAYFETYFGQPKKKTKKKAEKKPDGKKSDKKGKSSVTLASFFFALIAVAVVVCGAYFIKNTIPAVEPKETTTAAAVNVATTEADTTDEETSADETTAETTTEETTTEETTAQETTTEEKTTADSDTTAQGGAATTAEATTTAKQTTTKATTTTKQTTTKATTTTKPYTTKPVTTTTKPATTTTKPATTTTKPATTTTKPTTTTDPYGINNVAVQKPSKYLSSTFTVYATQEGVKLRNKPSTSGERILYLSKGGDLTVYAEQNGFYYVRSNRYGVYGWVAKAYASKTRPTADDTIKTKGTVACDVKYSEAKMMTTTDGLNLRKGPGKSYDIITLIPKGYPVKVIGEKSGVSGWVYVVDTTYGYAGWMSTAYLK